jgi:hypothetical protein
VIDSGRKEDQEAQARSMSKRVDEIKRVMRTTQLDINDAKKPLTTDHHGHPLLVKKENPASLPIIIAPPANYVAPVRERGDQGTTYRPFLPSQGELRFTKTNLLLGHISNAISTISLPDD